MKLSNAGEVSPDCLKDKFDKIRKGFVSVDEGSCSMWAMFCRINVYE